MQSQPSTATRRHFLKESALAGTALVAGGLANVHAAGDDVVRIGLVGCGRRGTGAAENCLMAAGAANPRVNVRLVAMGEAFRDPAVTCRTYLTGVNAIRAKVDVPDDRIFVGIDAYQHVIESSDLVILTAPPGFRPTHLRAALTARKHVFAEKPIAVDGPGIRTVLACYEDANRQRLSVVCGTQRRYQTSYLESMKRIHEGEIGKITAARCYWNQTIIGHRDRQRAPGMTDLEWQLRNWYYFTWLSGDHICEQHVHNLDAINWALGDKHPLRAVGMGGRQVRTAPRFGNIFDHFAVDLEYPDDVHVMSMCRQMAGCENNVSETITGTKGIWTSQRGYRITGEHPWNFSPRNRDNEPYQQEHVALLQSIKASRPINDLKRIAESTLTAIMGRMSCYTGQAITWERALNSQTNLMPENLSWNMSLPDPPVAVPGQTRIS